MVFTHSAVLESDSSLKAGRRFMASGYMGARSTLAGALSLAEICLSEGVAACATREKGCVLRNTLAVYLRNKGCGRRGRAFGRRSGDRGCQDQACESPEGEACVCVCAATC